MSSLRSRLLWLLGGAMAALSVALGGVVFFSGLHEADELFDHHLEQMALSLRDGRFDAVTANLLRQPAGETEFEFVIRVRTGSGERIHAKGPGPEFPRDPPAGLSTIGSGPDAWRLYSIRANEGTIDVAQSMALRHELAWHFALSSVAPVLVVLPLLLLFVGWAVRHALAPLETMAAQIERRTEHRLEPIASTDVPAEMLPVLRSTNGLLMRLRAAFDAQRAFVADAAHELRSPLTAVKLQAQLLGRAQDTPTRVAAQARLEAGVDRAVQLAEQLLVLAREEGRPADGEPQAHCLAAAAQLALDDVAMQAALRSVQLVWLHAERDAAVNASPEALRLIARNLLDNAVRHAPPGSRVEARVGGVDDALEFTVDDAGPGMPADERARAFDRFYRGAHAAPGGSGLGLAIVQAVASRCGARVALETSPLGGLRARVRFARPAQ